MTESTLTPPDVPQQQAPQRERSSIGFPYNDLNDGIEVAQAVHALGDRCSNDQLAPQLHYSSVENGAYTLKLSTARHFNLISYSKEGITLTPLGHRIVDPTQQEAARSDAFLAVPLYRELFERYRGRSLPPTNLGLEAVLVDIGVAAKQKDKARQALQRSAEQAGYFYQGRERLVMPAVANREPNRHERDPEDGQRGGSEGGGGGADLKLPTLVKGMIEKLPVEGGSWSQDERDRWIKGITLIIDMVYTVEPLQIAAPRNGEYS